MNRREEMLTMLDDLNERNAGNDDFNTVMLVDIALSLAVIADKLCERGNDGKASD